MYNDDERNLKKNYGNKIFRDFMFAHADLNKPRAFGFGFYAMLAAMSQAKRKIYDAPHMWIRMGKEFEIKENMNEYGRREQLNNDEARWSHWNYLPYSTLVSEIAKYGTYKPPEDVVALAADIDTFVKGLKERDRKCLSDYLDELDDDRETDLKTSLKPDEKGLDINICTRDTTFKTKIIEEDDDGEEKPKNGSGFELSIDRHVNNETRQGKREIQITFKGIYTFADAARFEPLIMECIASENANFEGTLATVQEQIAKEDLRLKKISDTYDSLAKRGMEVYETHYKDIVQETAKSMNLVKVL